MLGRLKLDSSRTGLWSHSWSHMSSRTFGQDRVVMRVVLVRVLAVVVYVMVGRGAEQSQFAFGRPTRRGRNGRAGSFAQAYVSPMRHATSRPGRKCSVHQMEPFHLRAETCTQNKAQHLKDRHLLNWFPTKSFTVLFKAYKLMSSLTR